ncbi:unnamed protein product [Diamesa hyperborea]
MYDNKSYLCPNTNNNTSTEFDDYSRNMSFNNVTLNGVEIADDNNNPFVLNLADLILVVLFCLMIIITIIGNTLVILSVITTRRLRTVTNCFVMSLAVADWLVGIAVMPPAVAVHLMGSWHLGWILCDIWISLDVLLCTASILSLCAISIDRYLAVTQPLNYSRRRRSKRLAMLMILVVWILALAITCPPILGWYEPGRRALLECRYNQNEGYVVFSAMGSFFIPMAVMIYVYVRISCVVASRHDQMAEIKVHQKSSRTRELDNDYDDDSENEPKVCQSRKRSADQLSSSTWSSDGVNLADIKTSNQTTSMINLSNNIVNNNNNTSINGNSQLHSNQYTARGTRSHPKSVSTRISSLKRENKTTRTLSIVVGGFIACWFPFFIYYLLIPFIPSQYVSSTLQAVLTWLGWTNSAINPFIYAFYSVDFRAAFWRLTLRRFFKANKKSPYPINSFSTRQKS